jgi:hypothetical protein
MIIASIGATIHLHSRCQKSARKTKDIMQSTLILSNGEMMTNSEDPLKLPIKILFYSGVLLILGASVPLFGIYGAIMIAGFLLVVAAILAARDG